MRHSIEHKPARPSINAQLKYWDRRWGRQRSPNEWQRRRAKAVMDIACELDLHQPRILDLGCGTGFATQLLRRLGRAEGVDLSPAAIAMARADYPGLNFRAGNFFEIRFEPAAYDLIVCQEVLPHVDDQPRLIDIMADALRDQGYLILTAANKFVMRRLTGDDGGPVGVGPRDPDEHIKHWLTRSELRALLRPHFNILKSTTIMPIGHRGILRLINSHKLNCAFKQAISPARIEALKGRLGWGYTIVILARKRDAGALR